MDVMFYFDLKPTIVNLRDVPPTTINIEIIHIRTSDIYGHVNSHLFQSYQRIRLIN